MGLFTRKKQSYVNVPHVSNKVPIEIIANKFARDEVIQDAKKAQEHLNKLLVENGFTIKIYLAAGGKAPAHKKIQPNKKG